MDFIVLRDFYVELNKGMLVCNNSFSLDYLFSLAGEVSMLPSIGVFLAVSSFSNR